MNGRYSGSRKSIQVSGTATYYDTSNTDSSFSSSSSFPLHPIRTLPNPISLLPVEMLVMLCLDARRTPT